MQQTGGTSQQIVSALAIGAIVVAVAAVLYQAQPTLEDCGRFDVARQALKIVAANQVAEQPNGSLLQVNGWLAPPQDAPELSDHDFVIPERGFRWRRLVETRKTEFRTTTPSYQGGRRTTPQSTTIAYDTWWPLADSPLAPRLGGAPLQSEIVGDLPKQFGDLVMYDSDQLALQELPMRLTAPAQALLTEQGFVERAGEPGVYYGHDDWVRVAWFYVPAQAVTYIGEKQVSDFGPEPILVNWGNERMPVARNIYAGEWHYDQEWQEAAAQCASYRPDFRVRINLGMAWLAPLLALNLVLAFWHPNTPFHAWTRRLIALPVPALHGFWVAFVVAAVTLAAFLANAWFATLIAAVLLAGADLLIVSWWANARNLR
ncbi:hypothetical protein C7S18_12680 [Ahniella affigens]|uniref:Uncharacterized protein n=2 Tax=Ahniella affigens TaxID=2021234 RepID=A0A2P1PT30_9GAMM|nr:hypothetical protein C7S18_12680 [Ahniella affigens]